MPLNWKKDYETSDSKIDEQHRKLFQLVNKVEEFLQSEAPVPVSEIDRILRFLEVYMRSHFQYEEQCMMKRNCPFARENRDAHKAFAEYYQKAVEQYLTVGYSPAWLKSLHQYMEDWLDSHICTVDIKLRHHK